MTLKQFIEQENLMEFANYDSLKEIWNRVKIENIKKLENKEGYTFDSGKSHYRVSTIIFMNSLCYWAEKADSYGLYQKIPCNTRVEESRYPKSASWIGTLLVAKVKQTM